MSLYPLFPGWRLAVDSAQMEVCYSSLILVGVKLGNTDVRPATNVAMQWRQWTSPYHVSCKGVAHAMVFSRKFLYFKKSVKCCLELINSFSLRKQPPHWWCVTAQMCVVLLIGWRKLSTNQEHFPDLSIAASWNFCARSSDFIFRVASRNAGSFLRLKFLLLKFLQYHNDAGSG